VSDLAPTRADDDLHLPEEARREFVRLLGQALAALLSTEGLEDRRTVPLPAALVARNGLQPSFMTPKPEEGTP
jgi:hypothetical protein